MEKILWIELYEVMIDHFEIKRDFQFKGFKAYKNRDAKFFAIPFIVIQVLIYLLIPIYKLFFQKQKCYDDIFIILYSGLAIISVILLVLQQKLKYTQRAGRHCFSAEIYQHLVKMCTIEKDNATLTTDYDQEKYLTFLELTRNLEAIIKEDAVPVSNIIVNEWIEKRETWAKQLSKTTQEIFMFLWAIFSYVCVMKMMYYNNI